MKNIFKMARDSFASRVRSPDKQEEQDLLSDHDIKSLHAQMTPEIASLHNIELLSHLTRQQREYLALKTGTVTLYMGEEVDAVSQAEEAAALRAAPVDFELAELVGLNIGCGNRLISPYLTPVDIMRQNALGTGAGEHHALTSSAILALPDRLPFASGSVDYIVALHMLEHVPNPVEVVNHWLNIIKPGGGIGIVVPDWRYTWDARNDDAPFSHKWNPTPDLLQRMYMENWQNVATMTHLASYDFKHSFDFVLRKHGEFIPFSPPSVDTIESGMALHKSGRFLHGD